MGFFSADQIATLKETSVRVALLTKFDFKSETVRVWAGNTPQTFGGFEWKPLKGAGQIDGLNFNGTGQSEKITFSVPGIASNDIDILQKAISETNEAEGQLATVYMQFFDNEWQPVGNPLGVAWGFMQKPIVERSPMEGLAGGVQSISIAAENAFFNRSIPAAGRYTDRDQQKRSDGDRIAQFIPSLLNKTFVYPDY